MKKVLDTLIAALRDQQEKRCPRLRYIDGLPYAYCHVRKEWRRVKFTDK